MFALSSSVRIFLCTKPADMRKSFDGLFALARMHFQEDPYSGALFIFHSSRGNFIKILWWDRDGFAIFAKRLEIGKFRFPEVRFVDGAYAPVEMERGDLMMLLEGIDTDSVKRLRRYRRPARDQQVEATPKVRSTSSRSRG
ncbi:MAG: IS66 family insertion sequence element accessory protein TnpB [Cyanobacteria bacterium]|nr:IS66 family insertion sequence element accessory protein TnpB [Cyanobacteriota bacterium]